MAMTRHTDVVLFDLDDTLFDHRHAVRSVLRSLQAHYPRLRAYSLEYLEEEDFRLLGESYSLVLAGRIDPEESRVRRIQSLFASCGEYIAIEHARRLSKDRLSLYRDSRRPVPGAIPLLLRLKGRVRIGVVTNNFEREQQDKLAACGLTEFVDALVTSEEVGQLKPAPAVFREALRRLERDPQRAVMVGDSWDVDVLGALNAGLRAVWFNPRGLARPDRTNVLEIGSLEPAETIADRILA